MQIVLTYIIRDHELLLLFFSETGLSQSKKQKTNEVSTYTHQLSRS